MVLNAGIPVEEKGLSVWARLNEGDWQSLQLAKIRSDTVSVYVDIDPRANLSIFYSSDCLE